MLCDRFSKLEHYPASHPRPGRGRAGAGFGHFAALAKAFDRDVHVLATCGLVRLVEGGWRGVMFVFMSYHADTMPGALR